MYMHFSLLTSWVLLAFGSGLYSETTSQCNMSLPGENFLSIIPFPATQMLQRNVFYLAIIRVPCLLCWLFLAFCLVKDFATDEAEGHQPWITHRSGIKEAWISSCLKILSNSHNFTSPSVICCYLKVGAVEYSLVPRVLLSHLGSVEGRLFLSLFWGLSSTS